MLSIIAKNIAFKYQSQTSEILNNVSFSMSPNSRIGLVGPNGTGKSTLLSIIQRKLTPTRGTFRIDQNPSIGFLSQSMISTNCTSAYSYLWQMNPLLHQLKIQLSIFDYSSNDWSIFDDFEVAGGYEFESRISKNADLLGINESLLDRHINTLSGGEKTKVRILGLLVKEPQLLLLDEPTNHLDSSAIDWLQKFLLSTKIPYIIVSHDRRILNSCVSEIWELKKGQLTSYSGNYEFYKQTLNQEHARQLESYEQQQKKINKLQRAARDRREWAGKHQVQTGVEGFAPVYESLGNSAKSAMKRAKNVEKRLEILIKKEEVKKPFVEKDRKITLPVNKPCLSKSIVRMKHVNFSYGSNLVLDSISMSIQRNDRMAIVGPNGIGKTSLLKILAGEIESYQGEISWAPTAEVNYFHQENVELSMDRSVIEEVRSFDSTQQHNTRIVLGSLGLERDKPFQPVSTLSPGERIKVSLAKAILSGVNTLLLDEPTNHLELRAREMLEEALLTYQGCVIFVSHDEKFIETVATRVFDLAEGRLYEDVESWMCEKLN